MQSAERLRNTEFEIGLNVVKIYSELRPQEEVGGAPGPALHRSHQKHQDLSMTIRIKGKILNAEKEEKDQLMVSLVLVEGCSRTRS